MESIPAVERARRLLETEDGYLEYDPRVIEDAQALVSLAEQLQTAQAALRALADGTWTIAEPPYSVAAFARAALAASEGRQSTEAKGDT